VKRFDWQKILRKATVPLKGGHSGVDIHRHRASADKLLARLLDTLSRAFDIRLVSIRGGSAHNAIPRDSEAVIALSPANEEALKKIIAGCRGAEGGLKN